MTKLKFITFFWYANSLCFYMRCMKSAGDPSKFYPATTTNQPASASTERYEGCVGPRQELRRGGTRWAAACFCYWTGRGCACGWQWWLLWHFIANREREDTVCAGCLPASLERIMETYGWMAGIWRGRVDGWRLSDTLHKFSIHFCSQNFHTVPTEIGWGDVTNSRFRMLPHPSLWNSVQLQPIWGSFR